MCHRRRITFFPQGCTDHFHVNLRIRRLSSGFPSVGHHGGSFLSEGENSMRRPSRHSPPRPPRYCAASDAILLPPPGSNQHVPVSRSSNTGGSALRGPLKQSWERPRLFVFLSVCRSGNWTVVCPVPTTDGTVRSDTRRKHPVNWTGS